MAMNKTEQKMVQELKDEILRLKALAPLESIARDLPPPSNNEPRDTFTRGWDFNLARAESGYASAIYPAISTAYGHREGWETPGSASMSKEPLDLFSTAEKATMACAAAMQAKHLHRMVELLKRAEKLKADGAKA